MPVLRYWDGAAWVDVSCGGGGAALKAYSRADRSAGNLTLNSTTWANVDVGLDLTLVAVTGDVVEAGISCVFTANAIVASLDVATIVGGAVVNVFSLSGAEVAANDGLMAWRPIENVNSNIGGNIAYTLQAGDISAGNVTLRLRYKTATAANKTLNANANQRLIFFVKNYGPV